MQRSAPCSTIAGLLLADELQERDEARDAALEERGYLRGLGLRVTCVEFSYFQTASGERLLSADIVVGKEAGKGAGVTSKPGRRTNKKLFLEACDAAGRPTISRAGITSRQRRWGHSSAASQALAH